MLNNLHIDQKTIGQKCYDLTQYRKLLAASQKLIQFVYIFESFIQFLQSGWPLFVAYISRAGQQLVRSYYTPQNLFNLNES